MDRTIASSGGSSPQDRRTLGPYVCSPQRVSIERIVSGKGLVNVYEFLRQKFPDKVNAKHDEIIMAEVHEGGKHIGAFAYDDELCMRSMQCMLKAYGSEAGNLGLKFHVQVRPTPRTAPRSLPPRPLPLGQLAAV